MENFFTGKKALVIGGSGGIGRCISIGLAAEGVSALVIHGGHASSEFDSLISRLNKTPGLDCKKLLLDLTEQDIHLSAIPLLEKTAEQTDILCICYGPFLSKPLHQTNLQEWEQTVFLNYTLPGILISCALRNMQRKQWGRILLFGGTRTTSIEGFRTNPVYGGAKTALSSLVKSIAIEYGQTGITCNLISPGFVNTEYINEQTKIQLKKKIGGTALISPERIAETGIFLMKHKEINGALVAVDSGWSP